MKRIRKLYNGLETLLDTPNPLKIKIMKKIKFKRYVLIGITIFFKKNLALMK